MEDFVKFLAARGAVYEALAFPWYKEATGEYTEKLRVMIPVFKSFMKISENGNLAGGVLLLERFLVSNESSDLEELSREFARLFLIKSINLRIDGIILCESAYLSASGLIMQDERDKVLEAYYNEGFGKSKNFKETEDHLSAELIFLAKLSRNASDVLSIGDESLAEKILKSSRNFINEHLYKWLPGAVKDINALASSDYFKGLAMIVLGIVEIDMCYLGDL